MEHEEELCFTELHDAVFIGDIDLVEDLISRGFDVDARSPLGTPLQRAAMRSNVEAVRVLLAHKADPKSYSQNAPSPVVASIMAQSLPCLKLLVEAGADPDDDACGLVPLLIAAYEGETEIIKYLLQVGANPDVEAYDGMKPMEVAALRGHEEDFKILFRVTSTIPTYPHWSPDGVMRHIDSSEARKQRGLIREENFKQAKTMAEDALCEKNYSTAISSYNKAIVLDPTNESILSNWSLCWVLFKVNAKRALSFEWPAPYYMYSSTQVWHQLEWFNYIAGECCDGGPLDPEYKNVCQFFQYVRTKLEDDDYICWTTTLVSWYFLQLILHLADKAKDIQGFEYNMYLLLCLVSCKNREVGKILRPPLLVLGLSSVLYSLLVYELEYLSAGRQPDRHIVLENVLGKVPFVIDSFENCYVKTKLLLLVCEVVKLPNADEVVDSYEVAGMFAQALDKETDIAFELFKDLSVLPWLLQLLSLDDQHIIWRIVFDMLSCVLESQISTSALHNHILVLENVAKFLVDDQICSLDVPGGADFFYKRLSLRRIVSILREWMTRLGNMGVSAESASVDNLLSLYILCRATVGL